MKKIIILIIFIIFAILFWSPWMGEDGGENIIRKIQYDEKINAELKGLSLERCEGLSSKWAPFGRMVKYCEYGSWYIPFWWQPQKSDEQTTSLPLAVEELQVQEVPIKQGKVEPSGEAEFAKEGLNLYRGYYFDIEYPEDFEVSPTLPTVDYNGETYVQTDEAYFTSPDGTVEFFVYSPLWSGEPENYLIVAPTEEMVSEKTEKGSALPHQLKDSERILYWVTLKAKDDSYFRSYLSIKEQVTEDDSGSELHHVFGIKYQNDEAYQKYKDAYAAFKDSLRQYAD